MSILRVRRRQPPPPADPQPPQDPEGAAHFLILCQNHEAACRARDLAHSDHDGATATLATAHERRAVVDERLHDFMFKNPDDFGDDRAAFRLVRRETVEERVEEEVARAERALTEAGNALTLDDIITSRALDAVVAGLDDAVPCEQLLKFEAATAEQGLAKAVAAESLADRAYHLAYTESHPVRTTTPHSLANPRIVGEAVKAKEANARAALVEAREARRRAESAVGAIQERTRLFQHVLDAVAERAAAERAERERNFRR
jgi:hypothetical protein